MAETKKLLLCYNKGCGQKYDPDENNKESCCHHPGEPVFHDAYKGWSCCKKKCTDFTEFLNTKGCTVSFHSNIPPLKPENHKQNNCDVNEVIVVNHPLSKVNVVVERPDENSPMEKLPFTVSASLQQLLLNKKTSNLNVNEDGTLEIGTSCKNSGCRKTYQGEASNLETCIYHEGVPIFHEGLKFWSCCQRKTTDFDSFLDQVGCRTSFHLWTKKEVKANKATCRTDWHQTDSFVYVSIYAKGSDPAVSFVDANPVKLHISLQFDGQTFEEEYVLYGIIDVKNSSVNYAATKVEIKLKKDGFTAWKTLTLNGKV